ncbi:NadR type nicotinamide-nucleotide adenylyltransferase [Pseudoduganella flava]|uniref:NadR type nicotinamide-nucleotide adenylyltransferase n=1 Tax=Pseudoduganella flava TaxID=871742 RepID=A0A562PG20_9BURK|nr:AAA family ATPase [Pseudoduganella flava]TWI42936.1 NadR type nicotinamide-nucleotide adenylyltransferase [Pseudoduganella flava]
MPAFRTGLVVGKFCPLHLGHELVIGHAARQCAELIVISYTKPEFDGCAPARRERWLRSRFPAATVLVLDDARLAEQCAARSLPLRRLPGNDAPDDVHRTFVAWLCTALLGRTVDAVFTSEDYGDGFAATLARCFGHPVRHVCVDRARSAVPVSGTAVRADVHRHRAQLAPVVYADFVRRACFLGGESSGKSTMAEALAGALGSAWVPEFGRTWWEQCDGRLVYDDMLHIARRQVDAEERLAADGCAWLSCDTSPLTTLFYSLDLFGRADPELVRLAERPYDAVFLCAPDFPFVQDGTRREPPFRLKQHAWYERALAERHIPYVILEGALPQRVDRAREALGLPPYLKEQP